MATRSTEEFRRDAVRIATTSGLTRPKVASDLGVGFSPLNKWVQKHQRDDLMSGPHEDVEKENNRLRKEVRLLRDETNVSFRLSRRPRSHTNIEAGVRFSCKTVQPFCKGNQLTFTQNSTVPSHP